MRRRRLRHALTLALFAALLLPAAAAVVVWAGSALHAHGHSHAHAVEHDHHHAPPADAAQVLLHGHRHEEGTAPHRHAADAVLAAASPARLLVTMALSAPAATRMGLAMPPIARSFATPTADLEPRGTPPPLVYLLCSLLI